MQAILAFTNASVTDGGFHVVPGFHKEMESVAAQILAMDSMDREMLLRSDMYNLPSVLMDQLRERLVKVPVTAGSLVVWDSRLPHGNHPNRSPHFRMVQYIRMMPVYPRSASPAAEAAMRATIRALIPGEVELTPLGRKLLRQQSWFGADREARVARFDKYL
jgi:ectoine hydroxylase-related dioxygenase (phytanoyl-CoA dioxygenase family)